MPVHKIKSRHLSLISTAFGRRSFYQSSTTDSTKINRPGNNIRMYWPNFWWSTLHVQQIFLKKLLLKFVVHIFTLLLTPFCVQIGQSFEARWVFKHSEEFRNWRHFASIAAICRFSNILQRLTVPPTIDRFGRKRCQKKRKDVDYTLLWDLFQKYLVVHEQSAVKFLQYHTYVIARTDYSDWICISR